MANVFFTVLFVLSTCWGAHSPNQNKHSENGTTGTEGTTDEKKHEVSRLPDFTRLAITCLGLSMMLILSYAVVTLHHKLKIHRTMSQQDVVQHQHQPEKVGRGHRSYKEKVNSIYLSMPDKVPAQGAGHDL